MASVITILWEKPLLLHLASSKKLQISFDAEASPGGAEALKFETVYFRITLVVPKSLEMGDGRAGFKVRAQ